MTRSQDRSSTVTECSLRLSDAVPPRDSAVANREIGMLRIEKVERADVCAAAVDAVWQRVDLGFPVGKPRVGAGQHRAGQMGCGGHDVQSGQNALN